MLPAPAPLWQTNPSSFAVFRTPPPHTPQLGDRLKTRDELRAEWEAFQAKQKREVLEASVNYRGVYVFKVDATGAIGTVFRAMLALKACWLGDAASWRGGAGGGGGQGAVSVQGSQPAGDALPMRAARALSPVLARSFVPPPLRGLLQRWSTRTTPPSLAPPS